jgi:hypothetical protein
MSELSFSTRNAVASPAQVAFPASFAVLNALVDDDGFRYGGTLAPDEEGWGDRGLKTSLTRWPAFLTDLRKLQLESGCMLIACRRQL